MMCDEHIVFNVGRTFLSDHFEGRNTRVTLLSPKRLTLRVVVADLAVKRNIKMAFPQFAELWKLIDLLVRKDFRQANLDSWYEFLRRNAKVLLGIDDGLIVGMCVWDRGEMLGGGPGVLIDHACSGWIAQMYWQYYLYTDDVKFLRERAYPFMHGVMRVYEEMFEEKAPNVKMAS